MTLRKASVYLAAFTVAVSTATTRAGDIVETAVGAGSFKTLAAALGAADLVDVLKSDGPFTVFAPTDEAFAKLPAGTVEALIKPENKQKLIDILTYHVVKGNVPASQVVKITGAKSVNGQRIDVKVANGQVRVDNANVVKTDIVCSNGVIHVIDQVILPASDDIPTTAKKAGDFGTLLAAAKAAGLVEALSGKGPLTVFAPTDEAFASLPAGTVESLLKPENKAKLAAILKYHVVPGRVYSTDALKLGSAKTLQGSSIKIAASGKGAKVNNANLVALDIDASNGVIHVIDKVLLPSSDGQANAARTREMIETAVRHGAPLYNAGHSSQCAKVYMSTMENLLTMDNHGLSDHAVRTMTTALNSARHSSCSDTQAWTLRSALDLAYQNARGM